MAHVQSVQYATDQIRKVCIWLVEYAGHTRVAESSMCSVISDRYFLSSRKFLAGPITIRPNLSVNVGKAVYKCGVLFFSISMSLAFVLSLPFKV